MSTRSCICKELDDGFYLAVYCHADGYLSHNGRILNEFYNNAEIVDELLKNGDLSYLGSRINFNPDIPKMVQDDVCIFYRRDYNEQHTEARKYRLNGLNSRHLHVEYIYIFTLSGEWKHFKNGYLKNGLRSLSDDLSAK